MRTVALIVGLLCSSQGFAATVSSGFVKMFGSLGYGEFHLVGADFDVQGFFEEAVGLTDYQIFLPGTAIPANLGTGGSDVGFGSGTMGGVSFGSLDWGSTNAEGGQRTEVARAHHHRQLAGCSRRSVHIRRKIVRCSRRGKFLLNRFTTIDRWRCITA